MNPGPYNMDLVTSEYLRSMASKIEALEAIKGRVNENLPEVSASIQRLAHMLKGSAGTYGFPEVSFAAKALEEVPATELLPKIESLIQAMRTVIQRCPVKQEGVLIVDDDPDVANILKDLLALPHREIYVARAAKEARDILIDKEISLIILDLILPDTDGRNFLIHLREQPRTALVPVIVLSGYSNVQIKTECFALGANEYFEKPFDPGILSSAVATELARMEKISSRTFLDLLTQIPNRAAFHDALRRQLSLLKREGRPFSIALLDLDEFKFINEKCGHSGGDRLLCQFSAAVSKLLRESDFLARWGGDEFVILFPNTLEEVARTALERILSLTKRQEFQIPDGTPFIISFSAGVLGVKKESNLEQIFEEVDHLLCHAKQMSRSSIVSSRDVSKSVKQRILLAEDDAIITSLVKQRLKFAGFEVAAFEDGRAAYKAASQGGFSLFILDVKIPGIDGFELLTKLRALPFYHSTPIVVLTAMGNEKDIVRGFSLGASDYILKPFSPVELVARVRRLLTK